MGIFYSTNKINIIHNNISELVHIGIQIGILSRNEIKKLDENIIRRIRKLYSSFYFPCDSLRQIEEALIDDYYHLKQILKNHIREYNKYNSSNIDEEKYIKTTLEELKPTLRIINKYI